MCFGILYTLHTLDHAVDEFQTFGAVGIDLEHEVKLTGEVIAGCDGGLVADHLAEIIKITRMLKADFHQGGQIVAQLLLIE